MAESMAELMARQKAGTALALIAALFLAACSGIETIPDDTTQFASTGYTRYAWRMPPLPECIGEGATLGLMGGSEIVRGRVHAQYSAECGHALPASCRVNSRNTVVPPTPHHRLQ